MIIGREKELKILQEAKQSDYSTFIAVYGCHPTRPFPMTLCQIQQYPQWQLRKLTNITIVYESAEATAETTYYKGVQINELKKSERQSYEI